MLQTVTYCVLIFVFIFRELSYFQTMIFVLLFGRSDGVLQLSRNVHAFSFRNTLCPYHQKVHFGDTHVHICV